MTLADQARNLAQYGRRGDTELAHLNPEEMLILQAFGGSGSINPATGLLEFFNVGGDPAGGAVGHGPGPGHAEPGSGAFGGRGGGEGGAGGIDPASLGLGKHQSRSPRAGKGVSPGMAAISNAVDQLGGVGAGETAKGFARGGVLSSGTGDEFYGLASLTGMSPQEVSAALSAARGSRPSGVGVGAGLAQNLAGIGVTPSAAETAASISGPGFGSKAEQVTSISDVGQASRAAGMVDLGLIDRLSGAVSRITPQSVSRAARALQSMRATPGGSAPLVGNLNVREPSLGVPVGFGDITNPGQVGRFAGSYASEIAQGIQDAMAQARGAGVGQLAGYQGAASAFGPSLASASPSAAFAPSPVVSAPPSQPTLSAPAARGPAAQQAPASAPRDRAFGADRGERLGVPTPALAPPSVPGAVAPRRAAPAVGQIAAAPRSAFAPPQGNYGPYDPALQRLLGLRGSTSLAFG